MNTPRSLALLITFALGFFGCASASTTTSATPPSPAPAASTAEAKPPRTPQSAVAPVNRNERRHIEFMARMQQGPVGLLLIGDSITDFWPRRGEWTWLKLAPYQPANIGISAERTEDVIWRLENGELDGIAPKVVMIMIGTNNLGHFPDEKPEWVAGGVKRIVTLIREKLPASRILVLAIFPRATPGSALRERVAATNLLLASLADGQQVRFLDIGARFLDANGEIPSAIMPDKLHPGPKGYEIWLDAVAPTLTELMR